MKPRLDPRVFLALPLSRTTQAQFATIQDELKKYLDNWHFIQQVNFHLTMRFFGEVPEDRIREIDEVCARVAPKLHTFQLNFNRVSFFGPPRAARVIYVGAEESKALSALGGAIADAFPDRKERRSFRPHVTMAKARKNLEQSVVRKNANMLRRLEEQGRIGPNPLEVDITTVHREFVLMETIWVGRAVEYEVRHRYPLPD